MSSTEKRRSTIQVKDLKKAYGDFYAVKGISFEVQKGEIVGFLGPNGAGKSTVMKILTCFMSATEGAVHVGGLDVYREPLAIRRLVGYQPENVPLYEEMVVFDYLLFMAKMRGVARADRRARIDYVVETCGLRTVMSKLIGELSKGFRQRVGLAQALIHDPAVLILDEPMSGLDPNQIIEIRDLIREIGREKTVIFSSHILQEIEKICDRILIIDEGKLVADGTLAELTALLEGRRRYEVTLATDGLDRAAAKRVLEELARHLQTVPQAADDTVIYRLTTDERTDLRGRIYELAREHGWSLLEHRELALSLEDVFKALTGKTAGRRKKATGAKGGVAAPTGRKGQREKAESEPVAAEASTEAGEGEAPAAKSETA